MTRSTKTPPVATRSDLAAEWDWQKNGDLRPEEVSLGSPKKVWWRCAKGHPSWEAGVWGRARGQGCPYCTNRKVVPETSLAAIFPDTARHWHPTKNGALTAEEVSPRSPAVRWWSCERGHEWQARASSLAKVSRAHLCPQCELAASNLAVQENEIATLWHPTRNGELTAAQVHPASRAVVWWLCPAGHEYEMSVVNRVNGIRQHNGNLAACPVCRNRRQADDRSLAAVAPEVAALWDSNRNGDLKPTDVAPRSRREAWWQCPVAPDHVWQALVYARVQSPGCPFCSGHRLTADGSLAAAEPLVAADWHPVLNGDLTPDAVARTANRIVWWKCAAGHEWKAAISNRTAGKRTGCPECRAVNCSRQEVELMAELRSLIPELELDASVRGLGNMRLDAVWRAAGIAIEFDGAYYHGRAGARERDERKVVKLEAAGFRCLRVREEPLELLTPSDVSVPALARPHVVAKVVLQRLVEMSGVELPGLAAYLQVAGPVASEVAAAEFEARRRVGREAKRRRAERLAAAAIE